MKLSKKYSSAHAQQGVILLEGLIAILIFSIGILGAVGLQATMIKSASESKYRSMAGYIVQQRAGQMWINQGVAGSNLGNFVELNTDIAAASGLPTGLRTTAICTGGDVVPAVAPVLVNPCYVITVSWQQPGNDAHRVSAITRPTE